MNDDDDDHDDDHDDDDDNDNDDDVQVFSDGYELVASLPASLILIRWPIDSSGK